MACNICGHKIKAALCIDCTEFLERLKTGPPPTADPYADWGKVYHEETSDTYEYASRATTVRYSRILKLEEDPDDRDA